MKLIRRLFGLLLSFCRPAASWRLDVKLGLRMLFKYPGLTLAGGGGIAIGVAIAAGGFSVIYGTYLATALPLEQGDRLVSMEIWDSAASMPERRVLYDFHLWRQHLKSVQEISAFRTLTPNLIVPGSQPVSVRVAAMSASGFLAARATPLLGRYLVEEDDRQGAAPVVVIGETIWRDRFGGDPGILGRTIQLGATLHSVVGVMPEGFAFPVNHRFWVPLRAGAALPEPVAGPEVMVFGRLAPAANLESAQAELTAIGQRTAQQFPRAYAQLQPRLLPYAYPFLGLHQPRDVSALHAMQGIGTSLLLLVCLNVAILVYSRTAVRQCEISIRTALGASRARIVAQLFVESLVLSVLAAAAGVGIASLALRLTRAATLPIAADLPFWLSFDLSPAAVLYAGALSVLSAAIVGIVPALKATRRDVQSGLRIIGAGGSGMRLGRMWTTLIVAQVGCAVAILPVAVFQGWENLRIGLAGPGFSAEQYLTAQVGMESMPGADQTPAGRAALSQRFARRQTDLIRRLEAEPRVAGVTFSKNHPGDERNTLIEIESAPGSPHARADHFEVKTNRVDIRLFEVFEIPVLAGRGFEPADLAAAAAGRGEAAESGAVVVSQLLAQRLFGGNALGRRIRYAEGGGREGSGRWYEIVGIVPDFPAGVSPAMEDSLLTMYHPAASGELLPAALQIRLRGGDPEAFGVRLREIAAQVDPDLHMRNIRGMEEFLRSEQWINRLQAGVLAGITLSVLMLSAAGIYALMSITVSQRRKEIGIRTALGADGRQIVLSIFSRAIRQLAIGSGLGMAVAAALERTSGSLLLKGHAPIVLTGVALLMMAVGCLASLGPARRGIRIEPTEALREQ